VDADLARAGIPRERVLATAVRILDETFMRVGNPEYAGANGSFGLTTLRSNHVEIVGSRIVFRFRGKSGKDHEVDVRDRRLARVISKLEQLPGQELFRYLDDDGESRTIGSDDVNAYLGEVTGEHLTAKDFRTWAGTVLPARALAELGPARNERIARKRIVQASTSCQRDSEIRAPYPASATCIPDPRRVRLGRSSARGTPSRENAQGSRTLGARGRRSRDPCAYPKTRTGAPPDSATPR